MIQNTNLVLGTLILAGVTAGLGQPVITSQPTNLSLSIGATAVFRVAATIASGPLSYQWRHQDSPVVNATNASLVLTNIQVLDAGSYQVVLTDAGGRTNSAVVTLDVDPTWTKITSDPLVTDPGYDWFVGAWADLDNDGFLDLFVARYDHPGPNPIYHNNNDGTFTRIIEPSLQAVQAEAWSYSWGDYDNDGFLDLFVPAGYTFLNSTPFFTNRFYRNNGNGTFALVANGPIVKEGGVSSSATWVDYDRNGYLDLYVANGSAGGGSTPAKNWFYQNMGGGTFLKLTDGAVGPIISQSGYSDLASWVDLDNDGWEDLLLVNAPASRNALFRNNAGRGFTQVTNDPLVNEIADWGDAEWADYDNDGNLDVFLTTCPWGVSTLGPVALFHNDGQGHFTKMTTNQVGSLAVERANTYACCWGDFDNDGWLDLFLSTAWHAGASPTDLLYHNNGDGTFSKISRGSPVNEPGASYVAWLVDLNNDGCLDLVTLKHPAPDNAYVRYFRNNGNLNNWLGVKCVGTVSPRFATGTKVRVKATIQGKPQWQLRVIGLGGFAMGQNFTAHFGLGDATNVDVLRIEWTSGIVQELTNVAVRQHLTVTEPARLEMPRPGELRLQCWNGMAFAVEGSSNLLTWTPLVTATNVNLTGGVEWADPGAATQSVRFYRTERAEFVHPEALASSEWLAQNLTNPAVRILDARYPQSLSAFTSGHIPGAVMVDPAQDLLDPTRLPIAYVPTAAQFEGLMRRLGINNSTTVVAYDTEGGLISARLWWALRYYGHERVKLLDGGLRKWQLQSRPLEKQIRSPTPATFRAQAHPELRATMTDVQQAMNRTDIRIVDARDRSLFISGHIPSSKNVPASSNLDPSTSALLEPRKLSAMYRQAGIRPGTRVITSCGQGYWGALDLFVLYQLGYEDVRLYDGSWAEWSARGGPVE